MALRGIVENRKYYYFRAKQITALVLAIVGFALVFHRSYVSFEFLGIPAWVPQAFGGFMFVTSLWRVFRLEINWMRGFKLNVFPPGQGNLKQYNQTPDARWSSLWELRMMKWRPGDIFIGRPLREQSLFYLARNLMVGDKDKRHMLTISLTGGGKTTCAVVPNLLLYPGSAIVMDPKGELATITAARRGHGDSHVQNGMGQDVYIIDPFHTVADATPARFNPIAELDPHDPRVTEDAQVIADALIPEETGGGGNEKYFRDRGRAVLKAALLHVISAEPEERHNLPYIRQLLMGGDAEAMDLANAEARRAGMTENIYDDPMDALLDFMTENKSYNSLIANEAATLKRTAQDERSGITGVITQALDFIGDRAIYQFLTASDFQLADIKRKKTTVYLCLPALKTSGPYVKLLTLFIALAGQMMEREKTKLDYPVLFMFDEMAAFGYLRTIEKAFGLMRGMGMKIWAIIQDISQLQKDYPTIWQNIEANLGAMQILGVRGSETAKFVCEKLPVAQVRQPDGTYKDTPLLTPQELINDFSDPDERRQIYLPIGKTPAILEAVPYFQMFDKSYYHNWDG